MSRHLAIGDIHGCYRALRALSEFVGFRVDDTIITLGDYPNRGPDTNAVIDWLIQLDASHNLVPLRGNHDIMMVAAREGGETDYRRWFGVGGDRTLASYSPVEGDPGEVSDIPDAHWEFLENRLLPYFETDTHFFVHANAYADVPLNEQPEFVLHWEKFNNPAPHQSGKTMVCGHTSQKSGLPINNGHAICIDTRAFRGGWLSCLDVASGEVWQANEQRQTRRFQIDDPPA